MTSHAAAGASSFSAPVSQMGWHSPAPWTFDHDWRRIPSIIDADGNRIASIEKDFVSGGRVKDLSQREANARLITASPSLLRFARILAGHDDQFQVAIGGNPIAVDKMLAELRAALKDATGA